MNKSILPPWLAAIVIITYRGAKNGNAANNPVPHFTIPPIMSGPSSYSVRSL